MTRDSCVSIIHGSRRLLHAKPNRRWMYVLGDVLRRSNLVPHYFEWSGSLNDALRARTSRRYVAHLRKIIEEGEIVGAIAKSSGALVVERALAAVPELQVECFLRIGVRDLRKSLPVGNVQRVYDIVARQDFLGIFAGMAASATRFHHRSSPDRVLPLRIRLPLTGHHELTHGDLRLLSGSSLFEFYSRLVVRQNE